MEVVDAHDARMGNPQPAGNLAPQIMERFGIARDHPGQKLERHLHPKPFIPQWPDIHQLFGRLMSKTFCREVAQRFPSDEAAKQDPTGFTELIRTLETCGRTLDNVRK